MGCENVKLFLREPLTKRELRKLLRFLRRGLSPPGQVNGKEKWLQGTWVQGYKQRRERENKKPGPEDQVFNARIKERGLEDEEKSSHLHAVHLFWTAYLP